jgi:glycoprotein endo-alpha-1,2-mannosidase
MQTIIFKTLPFLCCCAVVGSAADIPREPGLLDFIAANHARRFAGPPHEVLAFYYTWYGRPERQGRWIHWGGENAAAHEIPESRHYPARGAYDSQDPELIGAHIAEAKACGLTGFIATWWGQGSFEDRAFHLLLDHADKQNFKVTVYWETAPGKGREQIDRAIGDLVYLLKHYGSRPAFLKVDGKPVIFAYGRVMEEIPLASWPAIISGARAGAGDFLLIADGYTENFVHLFDGVHIYNNCAQVAGKSPEALRVWSAAHDAAAVNLARRRGRISCVTVIPGYDDTKIRKPGLNASRQAGQTYRVLWEEALKADPDWVLITSWNEWHEGSEIEPSWEDGDQYLKLTAEYAPRFLSQKPGRAPTPPLDGETKRKLQALFKGRTIGLLPDFGDAAFWLLDAGLTLKELSWADVADPAIFNPRNFPIVLHAGGEHYTGTGRVAGDVLPALQHYLTQGGFLISMPREPFPFYYDDTSGRPQVIANQIGLPVQQGWEQPPAGARLIFSFDTNSLPAVPATAPFPAGGDLRWRPANRAAAGREDLYLPLASLADAQGRLLGEGIAYVEHRTPPLQGGRTLYVWMRMGDVAGEDKLMPAVFQFAGEKIGKPQ